MHALKKTGMKSAVWCYTHLNTGCFLILEVSLHSAWILTALPNLLMEVAYYSNIAFFKLLTWIYIYSLRY